jgi:hypothetical protein
MIMLQSGSIGSSLTIRGWLILHRTLSIPSKWRELILCTYQKINQWLNWNREMLELF